MLFKPLMGTQLSGSMAGVTASHNRGGDYFRQRKIPVNSNTTFQQEVRGFFSTLAAAWGTLTQAQRDAWDVFSANSPRTNRIGDSIILPPLAMYQSLNTPRLQNGLARVDDAPTTFGAADLTDPAIVSVSEASQLLTLAFLNTDAWANSDSGGMFVFISRPQSPAINFFKGPYRNAGVVLGNATTPPTSPATFPVPFPVAAGQKIFVRVSASDGEGRLSPNFRGGITVAA